VSSADTVKVVINDEQQYAIWPARRENPAGWQDTGCSGTLEACESYVSESWTDMRPSSLRGEP
jgi:MbtH protein